MPTQHISHKTADLIMDHDWNVAPTLMLYRGGIPLHLQMESLLSYLASEAKFKKIKFSVKVRRGCVVIIKV